MGEEGVRDSGPLPVGTGRGATGKREVEEGWYTPPLLASGALLPLVHASAWWEGRRVVLGG